MRFACSLASVGNICWAKPKHAFFTCQQSFAKFFLAPANASAYANSNTPWKHAYRPTSPTAQAHKEIATNKQQCGLHTERHFFSNTHARASAFLRDADNALAARAHARENADVFSRRTSAFAQKMRELFRAHHCQYTSRLLPPQEKTRDVSVAGWMHCRLFCGISDRRLPTVRHSHPESAVQPADRYPTVAPRTTSHRHRHLR